MDIGKEDRPIIVEPARTPVPKREPAPTRAPKITPKRAPVEPSPVRVPEKV
jgi:hypothetical protein